MRSLISLVGVLVAVGAVGCGSIVTINDGQGGEGAGVGEGGDGAGPVVPPNPPQCPSISPESYAECNQDGLACAYLEEAGCAVTYTCMWAEDCYGDGGDDGYGGYDGGCDSYSYWQPTSASCSPAAVDCDSAQSGDTCALPGDYCSPYYDECGGEEKYCGDDHTWSVSYWEDECCYDDCCYDRCWCDPYYCPDEPPIGGDYCDPCYDAEGCVYEIESECGPIYTYASCSPDSYEWVVEQEVCAEPGEPEPG